MRWSNYKYRLLGRVGVAQSLMGVKEVLNVKKKCLVLKN